MMPDTPISLRTLGDRSPMREILYHLRWSVPLWLVQLCTAWLPGNRYTTRLRGALARPFVGKCGKRFCLGKGVSLIGTSELQIGDDVYIARDCFLNCAGGLVLEDGVVLGPFVVLSTMQCVFARGMVRHDQVIVHPIRIGRGSWLAAHAVVKAGVRIGAGVMIGGNSAVVKDIEDHVLAAGVPAKVIGPVKERTPDASRIIDHLRDRRRAEAPPDQGSLAA
ncbi:MAG: acyltransferase [Geminicoccaceae bacterium]